MEMKKTPSFLNNQWLKEEIRREFRNYLEKNENKNETYGMQQKHYYEESSQV